MTPEPRALDVLADVEQRLRPIMDVQQVLLFGSRARNDGDAASDFDVLVIAHTDLAFIPRQGIARRALGRRGYALDLLVYTPAEAAREAENLGSAVYWALREGKPSHAL